jgi:hypothetical protein
VKSVRTWGDIAALVLVLAVVLVLVRPSSIAPSLIAEFGNGLSALIKAATEG